MNIYLDIDGVLLTKDGKQAIFVKEFLDNVTSNNTVFWLTTHCKGDSEATFNSISRNFDPDIHPYLKKIKATNWQTLKTEAIDFESDFLWFDDFVMRAELNALEANGKTKSLIKVDLEANPNFLSSYLKI